jgi:hypothetical protein
MPETIRGGGHPKVILARHAVPQNGPATSEPVAEANGCFMVRAGGPNRIQGCGAGQGARYDGLPSDHLQSRPGLARRPAEGFAIWLLDVSMSDDGSAAMAHASQLDPAARSMPFSTRLTRKTPYNDHLGGELSSLEGPILPYPDHAPPSRHAVPCTWTMRRRKFATDP